MRVGPGTSAVDLGAGTGKFTRLLLQSGAVVTAIEPVAAMRLKLQEQFSSVATLDGTAQALPLATGSVDAIFCAQAFHWFATRQVLDELHRVLMPGGRLGLIWNVRDESVPWVAALTSIVDLHAGGTPRFSSNSWREAFSRDLFSPLVEEVFSHRLVGTPENVIVDRSLSVSFIAALPAADLAAVTAQMRTLIRETAALCDRREISFPYQTHVFSCSRRE